MGVDDPLEHGLPFEVDGLWRLTLDEAADRKSSLFEALTPLDLPPLTSSSKQDTICQDITLEIPDLLELNTSVSPDFEEIADCEAVGANAAAPPVPNGDHAQADVWTLDATLQSGHSLELRTWEAFNKSSVSNAGRTAYLSEAGPAVFDAALSAGGASGDEVLPQHASLRGLRELALGRSSVFFQWNEIKQSFERTLSDVRTEGLSHQISSSFITRIMDYGTALRRLSAFAGRPPKHTDTSAFTALKSSVTTILDATESDMSTKLPRCRSFLQLQNILEEPQSLLEALLKTAMAVEGRRTEEDVISYVADHVHALTEADVTFAAVLGAILARVCQPWLDEMTLDLGLIQGALVPLDRPSESAAVIGDSDMTRLEIGQDDRTAMALLNPADRRLVRETRESLRILRQHGAGIPSKPQEPLEFQETNVGSGKPLLSLASDRSTIYRPEWVGGLDTGETGANSTDSVEEVNVWTEESQPGFLESMDARMSAPLDLSTTLNKDNQDSLQTATSSYLCGAEQDRDICEGVLRGHHMNPFDGMRPLVEAQSRRINAALLRHLFRTCELRKHLELQRAFQLFGSGRFVTTLSVALFSPETQSAERKRGTIPTGATMGLQLNGRTGQSWPPASSELRLTLMDVLGEAYIGDLLPFDLLANKSRELPGGLSFAIRELPDAEIERVMDAGSIYAVDFLRLQYTAPAPLDQVLTPATMLKYDEAFRYLLRLLRMVDVTKRLHREIVKAKIGVTRSVTGFVLAVHHFVTGLALYTMQVGIEAPWRAFEKALHSVEKFLYADADEGEPRMTLSGLRELHHICVETIRSRLFLKRKQEKIRMAIEEAFTIILQSDLALRGRSSQDRNQLGMYSSKFSNVVKTLLTLLDAAANHMSKPNSSTGETGDAESAKLLLSMLNWNGYYVQQDSR